MNAKQYSPPQGIRRAFFGKDSCLVFQVNTEAMKVFLDIGKKGPGGWTWNKAKINDEEMAEILMVLEKQQDEASFYHKFGDKETKIWVNRKDEQVFFRIEDQSKGLGPAQQTVMAVLLREGIAAVNVEGEQRQHDREIVVETETVR